MLSCLRKNSLRLDAETRKHIYQLYLRARLADLHAELLSDECRAGWSTEQLKAAEHHSYGSGCALMEFDNARTRFIRPEIRSDAVVLQPHETLEQLIDGGEHAIADVSVDYFLDGTALYAGRPSERAAYCFMQE